MFKVVRCFTIYEMISVSLSLSLSLSLSILNTDDCTLKFINKISVRSILLLEVKLWLTERQTITQIITSY